MQPNRNHAIGVLRCCTVAIFFALGAAAQSGPELRQILDRLDRLEAQNRELAAEVEKLKTELAAAHDDVPASAPTLSERLAVEETRTAEQAQSKVGASERFPIRITGMALFNTYLNSANSGGSAFPTVAASSPASGGATFRQTTLGLEYNGPVTVWGGKVSGALSMDFYGGSGHTLDQLFRLRTATIGVAWKTRSVMAGLDRSLLSLRDPESLAQVGVSPLTGAGNLWLWLPQARVEQDFALGENSGIRVQTAVVQTNEANAIYGGPYPSSPLASEYSTAVAPSRPGTEGRVEFFSGTDRRIEIAPAFHHSISHVAGGSAPADIFSLDWLVRIGTPLEFSGSMFSGTNAATLGGLQQGVVVVAPGRAYAIHSSGGWGQLTWHTLPNLWFNFFTGEEDPRNSQLRAGAIGRNFAYGANVFLRLAPNVLTSFEAYQYRTSYIRGGTLLSNHYDLGLAYRF